MASCAVAWKVGSGLRAIFSSLGWLGLSRTGQVATLLLGGVADASSNLGHVAQLDGPADAVGHIDQFQTALGAIGLSETPDRPDGADAERRADRADRHRCRDAGDPDV